MNSQELLSQLLSFLFLSLSGITPLITNEVGLFVETTFGRLEEEHPRNAVLCSTKTKLHHLRKASAVEDSHVRVAFPNDLPHSIRPTDRKDVFKYVCH